MCSLDDNKSNMSSLDNSFENLNLNILNDGKKSKSSKKQSLVLKNDELDQLAQFDEMLCEKFGVSKSKIEEHRKEIIDCLNMAQYDVPRVAHTINVDADEVHFGPVFNINQQIMVNAETNEMNSEPMKFRDYKNYFPMVDRMHWLAQPSVAEINILKQPAHYVIICHTATQEAFTQAENVLIIRLCQTFHIESQGWADIAYNFCIGSDSNVYEGRGWFAHGAHTLNYNACSVGIAFIGCFLTNLPPPTSLKKCKDLIAHGVKIGAISPDYELIGHRQCRPFLSPGDRLFDEIKTWKHFNPNIKNTDVCRFLES